MKTAGGGLFFRFMGMCVRCKTFCVNFLESCDKIKQKMDKGDRLGDKNGKFIYRIGKKGLLRWRSILVVVAIFAILAAISIPIFTRQLEASREATDLANVRSAYAEVMAAVMIEDTENEVKVATVYKGNIIKNLIMDCQSYTKYRPNETTGGIFVSWRRKEELPTGA